MSVFWVVLYALGVSRPTGPPDPAFAGNTHTSMPELGQKYDGLRFT